MKNIIKKLFAIISVLLLISFIPILANAVDVSASADVNVEHQITQNGI